MREGSCIKLLCVLGCCVGFCGAFLTVGNNQSPTFRRNGRRRRGDLVYRHGNFGGDSVDPSIWVRDLRKAAEEGDLGSIEELGTCYQDGYGVKKDLVYAAELYREAGNKGRVSSLYQLANCYENGIGVEKDLVRAAEIFRRSSARGHVESMRCLGVCYHTGSGVEKDSERALYWLQKAANMDFGDAYSFLYLGEMYLNGDGVEQDLAQAVQYFRKAADNYNPVAFRYLGLCYYNGWGVKKDPAQAVAQFEQASDWGDHDSNRLLANCYRSGVGVRKDIIKAAIIGQGFDKHVDSMRKIQVKEFLMLGGAIVVSPIAIPLVVGGILVRYYLPEYLAHLFAKAGSFIADYRKDAIDSFHEMQETQRQDAKYNQLFLEGSLDSVHDIALCKIYGKGTEQDIVGAFKLASRLSEKGHYNGMNLLGYMKMSGVGAARDTLGAEKLFRGALMGNSEESRLNLAFMYSASLDSRHLKEAEELVSSVPRGSKLFAQARLLQVFLEDQLVEQERWNWKNHPTVDFVSNADVQLVALIGRGQFGKVYLARFRGRWVAVKYISYDLVNKDEDTARKVLRERFTNQIIKAHSPPGVVEYIGFVDDFVRKQGGLIFELCADISGVETLAIASIKETGFVAASFADIDRLPDWSSDVRSSLRSFVVFSHYRRWPLSKILSMLCQVAESIQELHQLGFLHRDVAARNVLCDADGNVKLADFGLSKFVGSGLEDTHSILKYRKYVTPGHKYAIAWWAPECIGASDRGGVFSTNSDVYSFGVLMWQCFSHHDPFDGIDSFSSNPGATIAKAILDGQRPDLSKLDEDTPKDLVTLIQQCWETDPEKRPSFRRVAKKLARMQKVTSNISVAGVESAKGLKEKWFDVEQMYRELPLGSLRKLAAKSATASSFASAMFLEKAKATRHNNSPCDLLSPAELVHFPNRRLFDLFLVHTGAQKMVEVATMKEILETGGFDCFYDREMGVASGAPTDQMRFAMETSRHTVVLISEDFLNRRDPCEELVYAFDRMQWLRKQGSHGWESLWIVLYRVTVAEYMEACSHSEFPLPDIGSRCVLVEWSDGKDRTWPDQCHIIKARIVEHDNDVAIENWKGHLREWNSLKEVAFPKADWLYGGTSV